MTHTPRTPRGKGVCRRSISLFLMSLKGSDLVGVILHHATLGDAYDLVHVLETCRWHRLRKKPVHWTYSLIVNLVTGVGGGILASLVCGTAMSFLASDTFLPLVVVCWFLMFYTPFVKIYESPLLRPLWCLLDALSWYRALVWSHDLARTTYGDDSVSAWFFVGVLGGSGGSLLIYLEGFLSQERENNPLVGVHLAAVCNVFILLSTDPLNLLGFTLLSADMCGVLCTLFLAVELWLLHVQSGWEVLRWFKIVGDRAHPKKEE